MNEYLREQRRKMIVEAAREEFRTGSYAKATMRRIAELAHVGKSTIYEYYHCKSALLLDVVRAELGRIVTDTQRMLASEGPFESRWRQVMAYYVEKTPVMLALLDAAGLDERRREKLVDMTRKAFDRVKALLSSAIEREGGNAAHPAVREILLYLPLSRISVWLSRLDCPAEDTMNGDRLLQLLFAELERQRV